MTEKTETKVEEKVKYTKLEDLPGVGPAMIEKLMADNVIDLIGLAVRTPKYLSENLGINGKTAVKLIQIARDSVDMGFEKAKKVEKKKENLKKYSTGSEKFDELMNGGFESGSIVELFGEFGCHSSDTKVLTIDGEKHYKDIKKGDYVLGVDKNKKLTKTKVLDIFEYDYNNDLLEFKTKRMNLLITPNHKVYFKRSNKCKERKINANEAFSKTGGIFQISFDYNGKNEEYFDLMKYYKPKTLKYPKKGHSLNLLKKIKTKSLLAIMGWYISEGYIFKSKNADYIALSIGNDLKRKQMKKILQESNVKYKEYERSYIIYHQDFAEFMKLCGEGAGNKKIPNFVFEYDKKLLKILFESMMNGDGNKNGFTYYTSSNKLKEQFIILCIHLGYSSSWKKTKKRNSKLKDGREIKQNLNSYYINICKNPKGTFDKRYNMKKIPYKGKVWCFETETSNFFTIRDGTIAFSGNSAKTQIAHVMAVSVIKEDPKAKVFWIDAEGTFKPKRIREISKGWGLDPDKVMDQIMVGRAYNSDHQELLGQKAEEEIIMNKVRIKLIIVDSLTAHYRVEYQGRGTLNERQMKINKHMHQLRKMADLQDLLVVVTNQVMSNPAMMFGDPTTAIGGHIVGHNSVYRLYLRKSAKGARVAKLIDAPELPDGSCSFYIVEGGLKDI